MAKLPHSSGYKNNPNLKRPNTQIAYTQAQIDEFIRCSEDCDYFIKIYVKVVHVDYGLVPFQMRPYQERMVDAFINNRFVITKMPRQSGKSTTVTGYLLWKILFQDNQSCAILANKGRLANDLLEKIKIAYEHLPIWLQQGVERWGRTEIKLENGSKVLAAATSSSAIRGGSYNFIMLDEYAHVQRNLAEAFFTSVYPTISSGKKTQIIIVSTPLGMNHYYKMWMDAVNKENEYFPVDVSWREVPGYDEAFREQTIRNTSEVQWSQEYECEFLGSVNTLISSKKLRELAWVKPIRNKWDVDIYIDPIKNHTYVLVADTAHGVGLDYSAFVVVDITETPYRIAAKFHKNDVGPLVYPEVIYNTGMLYNEAFVLAETNDVGFGMIEALHRDLEYSNILTTVTKGRRGQQVGSGFGMRSMFGVKTDKRVKAIGCANIKDIIEDDKIIIQDEDIIQELFTFVQKKLSYEAETGYHDDLVMCLVLFGWLVRQPFFLDLTNVNVRKQIADDRYAEILDDLLPAGFIDAGEDEVESLDGRRIDSGFFDFKF